MRFFRYLTLFILMVLLSLSNSVANNLSRDQLLAAYIFKLIEHIHWQDSPYAKDYHIHVLDDGSGVYNYLLTAANIKRVHNKNIVVSRSVNSQIPDSANIVFIPNQSSHYMRVYKATENKNILLISDRLGDDRYALIDVQEKPNQQLRFKINKSNIINRGLKIDPEIIFLGGTEIDVALLYKKGLTEIQKQSLSLERLNKEIASSKQNSNKLVVSLKAAEKKISKRNKTIKQQSEEINRQQSIVDELVKKIEDQKTEIEFNTKVLLQKESELVGLQNKIGNSASILAQQNHDIEKQKLIIAQQINQIKEQTSNIHQQDQVINSQSTDIEKHMFTIKTQKDYLYLIAFSFIASVLLLLISIYAYRNKRRTNAKLLEYTDHLAKAKLQAEQSTKAKSIFLSCMTHELRSPLTSIIGFSSMLKENQSLDESSRESIDIINNSGAHLLNLINDVLDLSKIESGQIEFNNEVIDFVGLLNNVVAMSRVHADNKNLNLILDISVDCPTIIFSDATKLRRIFINLINNAIKYTKEGGVSVRVRSCPVNDVKKLEIQVEVEDSGIGIRQGNIEKIFKPFKQGQLTDDSKWQVGTGLGLSICKQLIELMGGSITVNSKEAVGSVFFFSVVVGAVSEVNMKKTIFNPTNVIGVEGNQKLKILIVEDLHDSALYLTRILENIGCRITSAENGQQSILAFQKNKPDLIFMDKRMPEVDGIEATRIIRQLPGGKDVIIVAISASTFQEEIHEIVTGEFDDFIRKPYLSKEVYLCMEKHLNIRLLYSQSATVQSVSSLENKDGFLQKSLSGLSKQMRLDLHTAVTELDVEKSLIVIDQIKEGNHALAVDLTKMVNKFDFNRLNKLTQRLPDIK